MARRRWLRELDGAVEPQVRSETRQAPDPGWRDSFPAATELRATMAAPGTQRERHENRGSEPERGGKEEKKRGRGDGFLEELEHEGGARGGWVRRRRRRHGERSKREKLALGRGSRDLLVAPIEGARARALVGWLRVRVGGR